MPPQPTPQKLPLSQIRLDPTIDRSHFDAETMSTLAASMKEHGLINAISVRARAGAIFEIIAGNRRYKAAQSLGWTEIDCRVYPETTTDTETELLALVDNLQRDDLEPIDQAKAFLRLTREPHNMTQAQIAASVGKTQSLVSQTISLLELPSEVQEIINRLIISPRHGQVLLRLKSASVRIRFAKLAADGSWSVRQLEDAVAQFQRTGHTKSVSEVVNGKAAPGQAKGLVDPLADLWAGLKATPNLGNDASWDVTYEPERTWIFRTEPRLANRAESLRDWFLAMGRAIGQRTGGGEQNNLKAPQWSRCELNPDRHVMLEWTDIEGADHYELFYGDSAEALKMYAGDSPIREPNFEIDASHYPHNQVVFTVRAFNAVAGIGPFSEKKIVALPPLGKP